MASRGKMLVDLCRIEKSNSNNINPLDSDTLIDESNQVFDNFDIENCPIDIVNDNISMESLLNKSITLNQFEANEMAENSGNITTDIITLTPVKVNNLIEEEYVQVNDFGIGQPEKVQSENELESLLDIDYVPENWDSNSDSVDAESGSAQEETINNDDGLTNNQNQDSDGNKENENSGDADQPLTKRGNPRKRRIFTVSLEERKKQKFENLKKKHPVLAGCNLEKCRQKCTSKISETRRNNINTQFWNLNWQQRKSFILSNSSAAPIKRPSVLSKRKYSYKLSLFDENRQRHRVGKPFFLTTLGYKKSNDWVVNSVLSKTSTEKIEPSPDRRGKQASANKIDRTQINEHIESYLAYHIIDENTRLISDIFLAM